MQNLGSVLKKHRLYSDFIQVKDRLRQHQFVCWIAGGAVRDIYLSREVYDLDLVTDATTEALKTIFPDAVLVGESFGVIKIPLANGELFDLATFREEADYIDGRRPSMVAASTPVKDAFRRDFTINALFWNDESQQIIDYTAGLVDLEAKLLKCVGNAKVRFEEDQLRIVRLIRFAAQLGFTIDVETEKAATQLLPKIKNVSGERIWVELKKIAEAQRWEYTLTSNLFGLFIKEIFGAQLPIDFTKKHNISSLVGYPLETLIFILMNLEADSEVIKKLLVSRLKLSRSEVLLFEQIQFALKNLLNKSVVEVSLEIEKRTGLKNILLFLSGLGFFEKNFVEKCEVLLAQYPLALVSGEKLKSHLAGPEIGQALERIRYLQLEGKIQTEDEAMKLVVIK